MATPQINNPPTAADWELIRRIAQHLVDYALGPSAEIAIPGLGVVRPSLARLEEIVSGTEAGTFYASIAELKEETVAATIAALEEVKNNYTEATAEAQATVQAGAQTSVHAADRSEAARDAAVQLSAGIFPTTTAGVDPTDGVSDGEYFSVPSSDSRYFVNLYQNNDGGAELVGTYPSALFVAGARAIAERADALFERSTNLMDPDADALDTVVRSTGAVEPLGGYALSGFVTVEPGEMYSAYGFGQVAHYSIDREFINRIELEVTGATWAAPTDAHYIRLNRNMSSSTAPERRLNRGASVLPFEPYLVTMAGALAAHVGPDGAGAAAISDGAVSARKTSFLASSANLFDFRSVSRGLFIAADGSIGGNSAYSYSELIQVEPAETYSVSGDGQVFVDFAEYDARGRFLRRRLAGPGAHVMSGDCYYVRLNMTGTPSSGNRMFSKGAVALPYVPYRAVLASHIAPARNSVTPEQTTFLSTGDQLFDLGAVTHGVAILSNGEVSENASYAISDYIPVQPGETYSVSGDGQVFVNFAEYDALRQFLRRRLAGPGAHTVSGDCYYVRLNMTGTPSSGNRMFNRGSVALPYAKFQLRLADVVASDGVVGDPSDRYMLDVPIDGVFTSSRDYAEWPEYDGYQSAASVYARFDGLVSDYPDYIAKQVLGTDDFGNEIAAYHLTPDWPVADFDAFKRPVVCALGGTHGWEQVGTFAIFNLIRDMCEHWQNDSLLEALRFNVRYIVIPVVNPSGWDLRSRKNGNGVDINRNYPEGWENASDDPSSNVYRGTAPLSEKESQYVSQVLDENPDINIFYDFHNFSGYPPGDPNATEHFIWIPTLPDRPYLQHMATDLIGRMTRHWRREYPWIPGDLTWHAGYTSQSSGAMAQDHAAARGIRYAATFEVCGRWWIDDDPTPYNATHRRTAVEAWANWLLINLRELVQGGR